MVPTADEHTDPHRHVYHGYVLQPVFRQVDETTAQRVIVFWQTEQALPDRRVAAQRARQVCYLIESPQGEIAGISTAFPARMPLLGGEWYLVYRMFIRAGDRRPGMMRFVTIKSFELMRDRRPADGAAGMVIMAENAKLDTPGLRRMLMNAGCRYVGRNGRNQATWMIRFDGAPR